MIRFFLECHYRLKVITLNHFVFPLMSAEDAAMENFPRITERLNCDWLHESAAISCPVAWMNIDMLTVEAARTMIGIARSLDGKRTMPADKIFGASLKPLRGGLFLHTVQYTIAPRSIF